MIVKPCGSLLKLYYDVSNKYAGLVDSTTLIKLGQEFKITLAATAIAQKKENKQTQQLRPRETTIEIVIYGWYKDMDAIGKALSRDGLYLQHPIECDISVDYENPQYWLRPGSRMPKIEGIAIANTSRSALDKELLDETRIPQLLRLFDCANGPASFSEVRPSFRLRTQLKE
jgi:hypothetical protein